MNAVDCLFNIVNNEYLSKYPFKYCLVSDMKIPFTINNTIAHPNNSRDFAELNDLINCNSLEKYEGIGISIQASNICAIDIDKCFSNKYDLSSADDRAKDILNIFKDKAYIEFSFSGKGLRILFQFDKIDNYNDIYYTKNSKTGCEFYQPSGSARYVTLTGNTIYNHNLFLENDLLLKVFLEKYMKKPIKQQIKKEIVNTSDKSFDDLMKLVKGKILSDFYFQELWFNTNHYTVNGISQESDEDFKLLKYLYENITQDKQMLKEIFEQSKYFKTKDEKHLKKWNASNYRYYEYWYKLL